MQPITRQAQEILQDRLKVGNKKVNVRVEVDKYVYVPSLTSELDYVAFYTDMKTPELINIDSQNLTSAALINSPIKGQTVDDILSRISSPYGMRLHPIQKVNKMHHGVDFNYGEGVGVVAAADGVVTYVCTGSLKYVNILHANGFCTRYLHLGNIYVREGQKVTQGQLIADIGPKDAYSTGPHLHFEVRVNASKTDIGESTDPIPYLKKTKTVATVPETIMEGNVTGVVNAVGGLRLRKGASTDSQVIKLMDKNSSVIILSKHGEWYKVKHGNDIGYAYARYITVDSQGGAPDYNSQGKNPSYQEVYNYIKAYCNQLGLPAQIGLAIAWTESGWRQFNSDGSVLVSGNDYGIMQINKTSHPLAFPRCENDWQYNVRYGLEYAWTHYKQAKTLYTNEIDVARSTYSAYNTGGNYTRWADTIDQRDVNFYNYYKSSPWNKYMILGGTGAQESFGIVTANVVNVRSSPEILPSNILLTVNKGMALENLGLTDEWYRVRLVDGRIGYIHSNYFKPMAEALSTDFEVQRIFYDSFEKYTLNSFPTGYLQDKSKMWKVTNDGVSNCLSISGGAVGETNTIEFVTNIVHAGRLDLYYKVDLVEGNAFQIFIDGRIVHSITGKKTDNYVALSIPLLTGSHIIQFAREKTVDGNDSVKIDNIVVFSYMFLEEPFSDKDGLADVETNVEFTDALVVKADDVPVFKEKDFDGQVILRADRGMEFPCKEYTYGGWATVILDDGETGYIQYNDSVVVYPGGYQHNHLTVRTGGFVFDRTLVLDNVVSVNIEYRYDMRVADAQVVIENFMGYYSPDAKFNQFPENGIHQSPFVDYEDGNPWGVLSENTPIRIYIGYGDKLVRRFTGLIDAVDIDGENQTLIIRCSNMMKKLNNCYTYKELRYPPNGDPDTAWLVSSVIHDLVQRAGLTGWRRVEDDLRYPDVVIEETLYTEVYPDSKYVTKFDEFGQPYEVLIESLPVDGGYSNPFVWGSHVIKVGSCLADEIEEACQQINYWQRCDRYGTYRCTPVKYNMVPVTYFKDTENIISLNKTIDYTKTKNHIIVTGAGGDEHFFDIDLWKSVKGELRSCSVNVPWADTYGKKRVVATKMFADMKRQARTLQCVIEGNPYLDLLDTIGIEHAKTATKDVYIIKGIRDTWSVNTGYLTFIDLTWLE